MKHDSCSWRQGALSSLGMGKRSLSNGASNSFQTKSTSYAQQDGPDTAYARQSGLTSKRASPEALTAHSGISTDPEASTDFALPLLDEEEAPSSSSKEERILSPRPNVSTETGADFFRSSFSTRGLRVNDGMGEVNGSDLSDKHVVIGWFG